MTKLFSFLLNIVLGVLLGLVAALVVLFLSMNVETSAWTFLCSSLVFMVLLGAFD